jgi:glycosyltransferase involved in cell wall biosynthesis
MGTNKKIVLITPGQPSSNPRIVKEAVTLSGHGYEVTVLYCFWAEWAMEGDQMIRQQYPAIQWIEAGGNPAIRKYYYLYTRVRHRAYRYLQKLFPHKLNFAEKAEARCYHELLKHAVAEKADMYIAHNLGALPIAAKASSKCKGKYAFDAEDLHRGQIETESAIYRRVKLVEDAYLPAASYITAASPLIADQYKKLYKKDVVVINNVFSKEYRAAQVTSSNFPISLFWFSQTIGVGRGIEDIIAALRLLPVESFSLTLMGSCSNEMKTYFQGLSIVEGERKINLTISDPVHPNELFRVASGFDIGLALEPGRDLNNQIALSNKIFTYLLAGNAVIFSDTPAQKKFHEENPTIGALYACGNFNELAGILSNYKNDPALMILHKQNALKLADEKYNWEEESKQLVLLVNSVFNHA